LRGGAILASLCPHPAIRTLSMILYGISTCDTCKKALKALEAAGHSVVFRDVRAAPLSESEISELVTEFGDAIVNRQSTTWRGLSDWLKASEPEAQLAAQPTLMKRPVIRTEEGLFLGWDAGVQRRLLG
jgi:Arsenate reductase and related proteins, glutaredoxin family